jgi:hypothetical protein
VNDLEWRKSSRSNASDDGACVEIAFVPRAVGVRDSKNTAGPTLAFPVVSWDAFRADLRSNQA